MIICPLCREETAGAQSETRSCPGCQVEYHSACLLEMGGCATLGCPEKDGGPPPRSDAESRIRRENALMFMRARRAWSASTADAATADAATADAATLHAYRHNPWLSVMSAFGIFFILNGLLVFALAGFSIIEEGAEAYLFAGVVSSLACAMVTLGCALYWKKRPLWIAASLTGALVLFGNCCGLSVGIFLTDDRDFEVAEQAAQTHFAVAAVNQEGAYTTCSPQFRDQTTRSEFGLFVQRHPHLYHPSLQLQVRGGKLLATGGMGLVMSGRAASDLGPVEDLSICLFQEKGQIDWQVAGLRVDADSIGETRWIEWRKEMGD